MMKAVVLTACLLMFFCSPAMAREKVILDTDMVEGFDDGVAMVMLANAPEGELLGVTTVNGNTWVAEGTAFAIRQLEIEGRQVPVAAGLSGSFRAGRVEAFESERSILGLGPDTWTGSLSRPEPASWRDFYVEHYKSQPQYEPHPLHAVDFIIETVRANPGEVTIAAIGPCGNLAMAVLKAPDIVPLIKRVVYMGGAFFQPGNVTPAAEFNWWFDPTAARITVRSPFKEQVFLGLDVCEKVVFRKENYEAFLKVLGSSGQAGILRSTFTGVSFEGNPDFQQYIWDVLVAAVIIDPSLITEERTGFIDVNDDFGLSYGQSLFYPKSGSAGSRLGRVIMNIDQERFWKMMLDKKYWRSAN